MARGIGNVATGGAADGARERFARAYAELFPAVYGYVHLRVGRPQIAEDLTAQIFLRALDRLATVRDPTRLRAWIFAIARRAVIDHYRAHREALPLAAAEGTDALRVDSPEGEVLALRFAGGLTAREVAETLGLSDASVRQIVHRALEKLRRACAEE